MRRNAIVVIIIALVAMVLFAAAAFAAVSSTSTQAEKKLAPQVTCPVTGEKSTKEYYTDYEGKRVYFCCDMCKPAFEKDPVKYMKVLTDKSEQPEAAPQTTQAPVQESKSSKQREASGGGCMM